MRCNTNKRITYCHFSIPVVSQEDVSPQQHGTQKVTSSSSAASLDATEACLIFSSSSSRKSVNPFPSPSTSCWVKRGFWTTLHEAIKNWWEAVTQKVSAPAIVTRRQRSGFVHFRRVTRAASMIGTAEGNTHTPSSRRGADANNTWQQQKNRNVLSVASYRATGSGARTFLTWKTNNCSPVVNKNCWTRSAAPPRKHPHSSTASETEAAFTSRPCILEANPAVTSGHPSTRYNTLPCTCPPSVFPHLSRFGFLLPLLSPLLGRQARRSRRLQHLPRVAALSCAVREPRAQRLI